MLRVSRLTDYGFLILEHLALRPAVASLNTRELATCCHLPHATVGKLLKILTREGLLVSRRGSLGGYSLARSAASISMAEIYEALEGPVQGHKAGMAALLNEAVAGALSDVSLWDMTQVKERENV